MLSTNFVVINTFALKESKNFLVLNLWWDRHNETASKEVVRNGWSHFRIASTDSKVTTTFYGSINSITGKHLNSFI